MVQIANLNGEILIGMVKALLYEGDGPTGGLNLMLAMGTVNGTFWADWSVA